MHIKDKLCWMEPWTLARELQSLLTTLTNALLFSWGAAFQDMIYVSGFCTVVQMCVCVS